jgi:hypothetical protein
MSVIGHIPLLNSFLLLTVAFYLPSVAASSSRNDFLLVAQAPMTDPSRLGRTSGGVRDPFQATHLSGRQQRMAQAATTTPESPLPLELKSGEVTVSDKDKEVYLLKNASDPLPLIARVMDVATRKPVLAGVPVFFQVYKGGELEGTLATTQIIDTDGQGEAKTGITVRTERERICVVASVAGYSRVTAIFIGAPAEDLILEEDSGNDQHVSSNEVPAPFVVRVLAEVKTSPIGSKCDPYQGPSELLVAQTQSKASQNRQILLQELPYVPVAGVKVKAEIIQGDDADFVDSTEPQMTETLTDINGEASFQIQVGVENVVTRVSAPDTNDEPIDFFTFVGFARPADIAVEKNGTLVVADEGLQTVMRVDPRVDPINGNRTLV